MPMSLHDLSPDLAKVWVALSQDANQPLKSLAEKLKMPYSKVRRLVETLVREGYIKGYVSIFNPFALGVRFTILAYFKTNTCEPQFLTSLTSHVGVDTIYRISGGYSLVSLINYISREEYEAGINQLDLLVSQSQYRKSEQLSVIRTLKRDWYIYPKELYTTKYNLDKVDVKLLNTIRFQPVDENHLLPYSTSYLAELVGKSQPSIHRRLQRLREQKIILRTTTYPHPYEYNNEHFLLSLKIDVAHIDKVNKLLIEDNRVRSVFRVGTDYQYRVILSVPSVKALSNYLTELYSHRYILDTETRIIFSEVWNQAIHSKIYTEDERRKLFIESITAEACSTVLPSS